MTAESYSVKVPELGPCHHCHHERFSHREDDRGVARECGADNCVCDRYLSANLMTALANHEPSQQYEKSSKKPERNEVFLQKFTNGHLYEAVLIGRRPYFLEGGPGGVRIVPQVELPDRIIKPPEQAMYLNRAYDFASEEEVIAFLDRAKNASKTTLYKQVKQIWQKYVDADDFHISICAADTIFTYFQDKIGLTHYLFFGGNNGSGKSINLRVLQQIAYRNMTSTDVTPANIYQFLGSEEEGQGTLCEDEADTIDMDPAKLRIYKNGYTTGFPVMRIDTSNGRKQYKYYTFSFKAFAAERLPDNLKAKGFNQRIVELQCVNGFPRYDLTEVINPAGVGEYQELADELREMRNTLLLYKLLHHHEPIPFVKLNIIGRENQLFSPVIRLFADSEILLDLLRIISKFISQHREQNANSLHAYLYTTIMALIATKNSMELESATIWQQVKDGLTGSQLRDKPLSYESAEFGVISQKSTIETYKQVFGASQSSSRRESRKLRFDMEKLRKLGMVFNLSAEVKLVTGLTDVTDQNVGLDGYVAKNNPQPSECQEKAVELKNQSQASQASQPSPGENFQ